MNIVQNAIRIIDQDLILVSNGVHDYQEKDGYIVDGGNEYQRYGHPNGKESNLENLILYDTDDFSIAKKKMIWGTYGKSGKDPLKWIKLIDAENDHLLAISKQLHISDFRKRVILSIIEDRKIITRIKKIKKLVRCV